MRPESFNYDRRTGKIFASPGAVAYLRNLVEQDEAEQRGDERRPSQIPPAGTWRICLFHPGRGWGKGYAAAHWVRDRVRSGKARSIALVGATQQEVRRVMVEKDTSGLLAVCPEARYYPGRAEVHWPSGARAYMHSAQAAEALRGPDYDTAWCDEVDSWGLETSNEKADAAWANLDFALRIGSPPQMVVTSTPKPGRMVSQLLARSRDQGDVVTVTGSTYDNAANLAPGFIEAIERRYKGTRLERQEIYGEVLEEVHGALWTPSSFCYGQVARDQLQRIVVGVDPSGGGDEIGIVAAGQLGPDEWVVLDDWSLHASPAVWARRAVELLRHWQGDAIVAERNFGGDMVESTIRGADSRAPVRMVTASRGKHVRAEPISLLYEQGKVWHRRAGEGESEVGLDLLEDEMRHMTTRGYEGKGSPNRLDAAVWALTELSGGGHLFFGAERLA